MGRWLPAAFVRSTRDPRGDADRARRAGAWSLQHHAERHPLRGPHRAAPRGNATDGQRAPLRGRRIGAHFVHGKGMRVLHVLERSAPELVGYTVRGGYILKHQRRSGLEPLVVTSPFFAGAKGEVTDDIDGIPHYRSNHIAPPTKAQARIAAYWTRMQMVRR